MQDAQAPGQRLAVVAESLYLANLLLAPGLAFLALAWLWLKREGEPELARNHLDQTMAATLWAGALLVVTSGVLVIFGGPESPATWLVVILWFVSAHGGLVLLGMFGLARALAGKRFVYPVVGRAERKTG
jgi:hypothetical protein